MVIVTATPAAGVHAAPRHAHRDGDAMHVLWMLGDGATAAGPVVAHVYGVGRFVATVTATNAAGEVSQAQVGADHQTNAGR